MTKNKNKCLENVFKIKSHCTAEWAGFELMAESPAPASLEPGVQVNRHSLLALTFSQSMLSCFWGWVPHSLRTTFLITALLFQKALSGSRPGIVVLWGHPMGPWCALWAPRLWAPCSGVSKMLLYRAWAFLASAWPQPIFLTGPSTQGPHEGQPTADITSLCLSSEPSEMAVPPRESCVHSREQKVKHVYQNAEHSCLNLGFST